MHFLLNISARHAAILTASAVCSLAIHQEPSAVKPKALVALQEHRKALNSGRIEWSVVTADKPESPLNFVNRYARNGDRIFENRGDPDGWTIFEPGSEKGTSKYPQLYLTTSEARWHHQETGLIARHWSPENGGQPSWSEYERDIRFVGIAASSASLIPENGFGRTWNPLGNQELLNWTEATLDGGLRSVTAHFQNGATQTWYLNPDKGWNPERIVLEIEGKAIAEVRMYLSEFNGLWLPEVTQYFNGGKLAETVRIHSATLNQADDPARFSLADLGCEVGTNITTINAPAGGRPKRWTGSDVLTAEKWDEDVRAGIRSVGPRFHEAVKGGFQSKYDTPEQIEERKRVFAMRIADKSARNHTSRWAEYVRDFIVRYQLDDTQRQRAQTILTLCENEADAYIQKQRTRFQEISKLLTKAKQEGNTRHVAECNERLKALNEPIDQIFEEKLKPRLEKLPTRDQRKAADEKQVINP